MTSVNAFTAARLLEPSSSTADSAPARELVGLARSTGARVVVVLMPERRAMREEVPAAAQSAGAFTPILDRTLRDASRKSLLFTQTVYPLSPTVRTALFSGSDPIFY